MKRNRSRPESSREDQRRWSPKGFANFDGPRSGLHAQRQTPTATSCRGLRCSVKGPGTLVESRAHGLVLRPDLGQPLRSWQPQGMAESIGRPRREQEVTTTPKITSGVSRYVGGRNGRPAAAGFLAPVAAREASHRRARGSGEARSRGGRIRSCQSWDGSLSELLTRSGAPRGPRRRQPEGRWPRW